MLRKLPIDIVSVKLSDLQAILFKRKSDFISSMSYSEE